MKIVIVDDERLALQQFQMEIEEIGGAEVAGAFLNPLEAMDFLRQHPVEAVFLDIEMPGMNGLEMGRELRRLYPGLVVIFITGYEEYALEAMRMKADFYLTKPYERKDIEDVLERAKLLSRRQKKRVFLRTFGTFDLFVEEQTVYFANAKAKELLALCVDRRGSKVTMWEAADRLWEGRAFDDRVKNLYRKAVMSLRQTLAEYDAEEIFVSGRGECSVDCRKVDCDYYQLLEGGEKARKAWALTGVYMREYSWAEETQAVLQSF